MSYKKAKRKAERKRKATTIQSLKRAERLEKHLQRRIERDTYVHPDRMSKTMLKKQRGKVYKGNPSFVDTIKNNVDNGRSSYYRAAIGYSEENEQRLDRRDRYNERTCRF